MTSHSPSTSIGGTHRLASGNTSPNGTQSGGMAPKEAGRQQVIGGHYFLGETLGKSIFGVVYQGLNANTGEFVAIKQIPLEDLDPQKVANITKEIEIFTRLDHTNIVRVFDAIKTKNHLYLVLELVEGGSVVLMKESFVNLPEKLMAKYVYKCLKGLNCLHKNGIVHNDIKGVNILINREGQVKLADCVQPRLKGKNEAMTIGQPFWMAPEVIKNNEETTASDIWSFGCTIIELFTGTPPYSHLASMAAILQIMKDEHPPLPEGASPEFKEFLLCCLQKDPAKRYRVDQLMELPWITEAKNQDDTADDEPILTFPEPKGEPGTLPQEAADDLVLDEEHLTLKVHLSDLPEFKGHRLSTVQLFVFPDTHAAAMVDVALRKADIQADPNLFCLVEIDNVTGEERRFNDFDLPKLEAEVLWQFGEEIRFSIKKKSTPIKEGWLNRQNKRRWQPFYYVLDFTERYFAGYIEKPGNRDEVLASHVVFGFHLIKWVYISDNVENSFVLRYQNGKEDVFQTESYEDMISWVNEIRYACDIHFLFDDED